MISVIIWYQHEQWDRKHFTVPRKIWLQWSLPRAGGKRKLPEVAENWVKSLDRMSVLDTAAPPSGSLSCFPLPTAHRPPPTAHHPRPTAHRPPLTIHGPRPTAHRPPPTAQCSPSMTHGPPPTAHRSPSTAHPRDCSKWQTSRCHTWVESLLPTGVWGRLAWYLILNT